MMRFKIPKVLRPLDLGAYTPEYNGQVIQVWVNPSRGQMAEFDQIRLQLVKSYDRAVALAEDGADSDELQALDEQISAANDQVFNWLAMIWGQGQEDERWSAAEVADLQNVCMEQDPNLWKFILQGTYDLIADYRGEQRKK